MDISLMLGAIEIGLFLCQRAWLAVEAFKSKAIEPSNEGSGAWSVVAGVLVVLFILVQLIGPYLYGMLSP